MDSSLLLSCCYSELPKKAPQDFSRPRNHGRRQRGPRWPILRSGWMAAPQADEGWWWRAPIKKRGSNWSLIACLLLVRNLLLAAVLLACTSGSSLAFEVLWKPLLPSEAPLSSSVASPLPLLPRGLPTCIRENRLGLLPSALAAKGRPGGGGGVGPKKKTPQQQAHQKQQQMLGGFGKQKAAKKKAESAATASRGAPKGPSTSRLARKSGVKSGEDIQDIQDADLSARDLPYNLVSPEVFEVYKLFGRLGDPLIPGASLPPCRRVFIERLFKGYTRLEGLSEDQFRLRLEYDWRFLLPLPRDPLAPPGVCTGASTGPLFEGLDLKLCKDSTVDVTPESSTSVTHPTTKTDVSALVLFALVSLGRSAQFALEDGGAAHKETACGEALSALASTAPGLKTKVMRRRTAFLWMYSRVHPPHLEASEGAKALQPPEALPSAEVQLQEARRRVSSEVNQQGLHPAALETLWDFLTEGKTKHWLRTYRRRTRAAQDMLERASSLVCFFHCKGTWMCATGSCCDAVLDRAQAENRFDELIGQDSGGALPRLWIDASEVPGLLGGSKKGAVKSESLQIKHIYPRGGRLMFRNPEAVSLRGSKPNPRGLPLRLSLQRLWDLLGTEITQRMQAFDWAAYDALEAEVLSERKAFLSCLRKTIGEATKHILHDFGPVNRYIVAGDPSAPIRA